MPDEILERSKNVAFDAFWCALVPVSREGGPANWLKDKDLLNHRGAYEPGGREFESLRARQLTSPQSFDAVPTKFTLRRSQVVVGTLWQSVVHSRSTAPIKFASSAWE